MGAFNFGGGAFTVTSGTFTPSWVGFSAAPTIQFNWAKYAPVDGGAGLVVLSPNRSEPGTGTSSNSSLVFNNLPADIQPATSMVIPCTVVNSSGSGTTDYMPGMMVLTGGSAVVSFLVAANTGGAISGNDVIMGAKFNGSLATKGLPDDFSVCYPYI